MVAVYIHVVVMQCSNSALMFIGSLKGRKSSGFFLVKTCYGRNTGKGHFFLKSLSDIALGASL